jgi:hemin uptake protein HemP
MIIVTGMNAQSPERPRSSAPRPSRASPPRRIRSQDLFGTAKEVRIEHQGAEYRLTQTRQGKLLLTK